MAMHDAQIAGLDMRSELFAHTIALAHGLKVAQVPMPMYYADSLYRSDTSKNDMEAPKEQNRRTRTDISEIGKIDAIFNNDRNTRTDVFVDDDRDNIMHEKGRTTFWWRLEFEQYPRLLYRRWLGLDDDGKKKEKAGRLCLPGLLLHPVKDVVKEG